MILHKNIKESLALNYWTNLIKIPKTQFKKACFSLSKASDKIRDRKTLPYGTLQIRILDKYLTQKIYGYILGFKEQAEVVHR